MSKILKYCFALNMCFLFMVPVRGQEEVVDKVYIKNKVTDNRDGIIIKWFLHDLYSPEGVNIYRKESDKTNWVKLNKDVIKKENYIPALENTPDEMIQDLVDAVNNTPKEELDGMVLLGILINAIQNDSFAKFLGLIYFDKDIEKGKVYQYKITRMINHVEHEILVSDSIVAGQITKTEPPEDITYEEGNRSVSISWKPDGERYFAVNIYRKMQGQEEFVKINTYPVIMTEVEGEDGKPGYPDEFYVDDDLINEQPYTYHIKAIDFFGDEGNASENVNVVPIDLTPPKPPKKLTALAHRDKVTLTWDYPDKEEIKGFNIYRSVDDDTYFRINDIILSTASREYTDSLDTPGGYYYCVTSVNDKNIEGKSQESFAEVKDITPPAKPSELKVRVDTGKFILTWKDNTENDLLGYQVFRRVSDAKHTGYSLITPDIITKTSYLEQVPENVSNFYEYKIAALDSSMNRSEFSDIASARLPDVTPPAEPYIKSVHGAEKEIIIGWHPNFEPDLAGYDIYRKNTSDSLAQPEKLNTSTIPTSQLLYKDRQADRSRKHTYFLVASDADGNRSSFSQPVNFIPPAEESLCIYEVRKIKVDYNKRNRHVEINWEVECSDEYMGVVIYRRTDDMLKCKPLTGLIKEFSYKDKLPDDNKNYYYALRVYYSSGELFKSKEFKIKSMQTHN